MENEKQVKNEQALVKKVGDIANVLLRQVSGLPIISRSLHISFS